MKGTITFKGGSGSGNFGHSGRPGKVGGSSSSVSIVGDDVFLHSAQGQALLDLAKDNSDYMVIGSAAARMYAKGAMSRLPNDIDVVGYISPQTTNLTSTADPRSSGPVSTFIHDNGTHIDVLEPGVKISSQLVPGYISEFNAPRIYSVSGEPYFDVINGVNVMKPALTLEFLNSRGDYDELEAVIRGLKLPRDYSNKRWYVMSWDEANSND